MTKSSRYPYAETVQRLLKAIGDAGNTVFVTIDQTKAAESVGMTMRPTTLIVFGNPKGGTPLMTAHPEFALELPLKLLVWEEDGAVKVAYADMAEVAKRYGIDGDPRINAMKTALDTIAAAAG